MKIVRGFALGLAALAMAIIVTPSGALANVAGTATVGDFLTSYAKVLKIELPESADSAVVVEALRASGVKLDTTIDTSKSLTNADVVKIGKANGLLRLTTKSPDAAFTSAEIDQFFTTYGSTLSPRSANETRVDAVHPNPGTGKGKGKQKGHQSPSEPE